MATKQAQLADFLDQLATSLANNIRISGFTSIASAGPGNKGVVQGSYISAVGGPGSGTTIGMVAMASANEPPPGRELVGELRQAAEAVREGNAPEGWVSGLLQRVSNLGVAAVDAVLANASKAAVDYYAKP